MSFEQEIEKVWRGREVKLKGRKVTGKTIFEVGLVVEGQAKLLSAVDTGRQAASITVQAKDKGTKPEGKGAVMSDVIRSPQRDFEVFVGTPVFYAPFQEFGTIFTDAQPFLRPALAIAKGQTLTILLHNGRLEFKEFIRRAA
jgi:HK97 gp10 family phage protein